MTINATENPIPLYFDTDGTPLDNGSIYFGVANQNPETNPITVYWDAAGTQPAAQPIKTVNGMTVRNGTPAVVYAGSDYSNTVRNKKGALVTNFQKASGFSFIWQLISSVGASLVGYIQAGTGAVLRTVQDKSRELVSVKDYGAVGDGVTDDSAAIQAAITYALATGVSVAGGVGMGSRKKLYFPAGVYVLSSQLVGGSYLDWFGERAILKAATNTFSIVGSVQYMTNFDGIQFLGGTAAISIATGNVDSTTINIKNCEFQQQTVSMVAVDNNSASTILNIDKCKFYNSNTGAQVLTMLSGDVCNFNDCWVEVACYTGFQIGDATHQAVLNVRGMCGVPLSGPALQTWFKNYCKVRLTHSRFGGESGGAVLVRNYAGVASGTDPNAVVITNNEIFCVNPASPVMFFRLPNVFVFENNNGLYDTKGFYFDSGAQTDDFSYSPSSTVFSYKNNGYDTLMFKGDTYAGMRAMLRSEQAVAMVDSVIATADVVLQIPANTASYGAGQVPTGVTAVGSTDLFGNPTNSISSNGTAGDSNSWAQSFTTALSGFSSDQPYTMEVPVEVVGIKPFTILLTACNQQKRFNVPPGKHILSFPFVYHVSTPNANVASIAIYEFWTASGQIAVGGTRFLLNAKKSTTRNVVAYGAAAPVAGNWQKGDRIVQATPTVGQPKAWVCTVAGTPGTWVSEGNL